MTEEERNLERDEPLPVEDYGNYMVKRCARSAADHDLNIKENIRPPPVLLDTIYHLEEHVMSKLTNGQYDTMEVYKYLFDRFRAIRQVSCHHLFSILFFFVFSVYQHLKITRINTFTTKHFHHINPRTLHCKATKAREVIALCLSATSTWLDFTLPCSIE